MRYKDKRIRERDQIRCNILTAALMIGKRSGWGSLSMRKIAQAINYTAPVIYEYFENKAALLLELTQHGFLILSNDLKQAGSASARPRQQLLLMCRAYWDFASTEPQLYRLMFGVGSTCSDPELLRKASDKIGLLFYAVIGYLPLKPYYTCWSVLHGLISIRLTGTSIQQSVSEQIFTEAVTNFTDVISPSDLMEIQPS